MIEEKLLTVAEAVNLLGVSDRTIRRYVRQGKLTRRSISTERSRETRFLEDEVLKLKSDMTDTRLLAGQEAATGRPRSQGATSVVTGTLDIARLMERYEAAIQQLGYLRGKLEAQENEVKMLHSASDERRSESEQLKSQLTEAESQRRLLEEQLKRQRRAMPLHYILYFIFGAILAIFLIAISLNR